MLWTIQFDSSLFIQNNFDYEYIMDNTDVDNDTLVNLLKLP